VDGLKRRYLLGRNGDADFDRLFETGPATGTDDRLGRRSEVIFLAAYPDNWPKLEIDIINTRHPQYCGATDS
jgi:hypothetical protein